jgi:hypothetical protein
MTRTIEVRILEAAELPQLVPHRDVNPYCRVSVDGSPEIHETRFLLATSAPRWNQVFSFVVSPVDPPVLKLTLFDRDPSIDDPISEAALPLTEIPPGEPMVTWLPLTPITGVREGGRIRFAVRITEDFDAPAQGANMSPPMMHSDVQWMPPPDGNQEFWDMGAIEADIEPDARGPRKHRSGPFGHQKGPGRPSQKPPPVFEPEMAFPPPGAGGRGRGKGNERPPEGPPYAMRIHPVGDGSRKGRKG